MSDGNQMVQQQRAFSQRIIDQIVSDPEFRQKMVDAPEAAMKENGYLEEYAALTGAEAEVSGYTQEIEPDAGWTEYSGCCITVIY